MRRILVAEDNPASRELLREILERAGYEVLEACDGNEALALAQQTTLDLALLDIQMPGLDGFAVLHRLRQEPRLANVRALGVSAYAMRGDCEKALAAGFDGYITKPIDRALLRSEIERLLQR